MVGHWDGVAIRGAAMSKLHLGGFVVAAAVAAGGADYVNQARESGSAPGSFGVSAYVATISARARGRQDAPAAPAVVARAAGTSGDGGTRQPAPASGAASGGMLGGLFGGGGAADILDQVLEQQQAALQRMDRKAVSAGVILLDLRLADHDQTAAPGQLEDAAHAVHRVDQQRAEQVVRHGHAHREQRDEGPDPAGERQRQQAPAVDQRTRGHQQARRAAIDHDPGERREQERHQRRGGHAVHDLRAARAEFLLQRQHQEAERVAVEADHEQLRQQRAPYEGPPRADSGRDRDLHSRAVRHRRSP